jgi:hypothetical protein
VGVNMIKVQYTHVKVPKQNPFEQWIYTLKKKGTNIKQVLFRVRY